MLSRQGLDSLTLKSLCLQQLIQNPMLCLGNEIINLQILLEGIYSDGHEKDLLLTEVLQIITQFKDEFIEILVVKNKKAKPFKFTQAFGRVWAKHSTSSRGGSNAVKAPIDYKCEEDSKITGMQLGIFEILAKDYARLSKIWQDKIIKISNEIMDKSPSPPSSDDAGDSFGGGAGGGGAGGGTEQSATEAPPAAAQESTEAVIIDFLWSEDDVNEKLIGSLTIILQQINQKIAKLKKLEQECIGKIKKLQEYTEASNKMFKFVYEKLQENIKQFKHMLENLKDKIESDYEKNMRKKRAKEELNRYRDILNKLKEEVATLNTQETIKAELYYSQYNQAIKEYMPLRSTRAESPLDKSDFFEMLKVRELGKLAHTEFGVTEGRFEESPTLKLLEETGKYVIRGLHAKAHKYFPIPNNELLNIICRASINTVRAEVSGEVKRNLIKFEKEFHNEENIENKLSILLNFFKDNCKVEPLKKFFTYILNLVPELNIILNSALRKDSEEDKIAYIKAELKIEDWEETKLRNLINFYKENVIDDVKMPTSTLKVGGVKKHIV